MVDGETAGGKQTAEDFDLLIAGGGMVGACFAWALRTGLQRVGAPPARIALVERRQMEWKKSFDVRSIALSRRSVQILQSWGIWSQLEAYAAPMRRVRVAFADNNKTLTLDGGMQGWDSLGHVLEAPRFLNCLHENLAASDVDFFCPEEIVRALPTSDAGWEIECVSGRRLHGSLLAAADGASSALRERLGIVSETRDYQSDALLFNAMAQGLAPGDAWECFLQDGTLALLPLSPWEADGSATRVVVIRVAPRGECEALLAAGAEELARKFEALPIFGGKLSFIRVGQCVRRPLRMRIAVEQQRRGLVLLGDAAHSLHPIGAQGFNLAMRDISVLAQLLVQARLRGHAWGGAQCLRDYERRRRHDQRRVRQLSDTLPEISRLGNYLPAKVLGMGLKALDLSAPLKSFFVRRVAGF